MSTAHGHRIFAMGASVPGEAEISRYTMQLVRPHLYNSRAIYTPGCRSGGRPCRDRPEFVAEYWYLYLGRKLRRVLYQCRRHATRYAASHGLTLPTYDNNTLREIA